MQDADLLEAVRVPGELQKLSDHHKAVAFGIVNGLTNQEIALEAGISESYVSNLKRDPRVMAHVEKLETAREEQRRIRQARIEGLAHRAIDKAETLLDSKSEKIQVKVYTDLLDRGGHPKTSRQETQATHVHVDAAKLAEIEEIVRKAALEGREIIDVTPTLGDHPCGTLGDHPCGHFGTADLGHAVGGTR